MQINTLPYGARFLASSLDPTTSGQPLPDVFLRPYYSYGQLPYFSFSDSSSDHSLQAQVKCNFAKRLQFGASWTWGKAMGYGDAYDTGIARFNDRRYWNYGPLSYDRTHTLVGNWVRDLPKASSMGNVQSLQPHTVRRRQHDRAVRRQGGTGQPAVRPDHQRARPPH